MLSTKTVSLLTALVLTSPASRPVSFEPPTSDERLRAIGSTEGLTELLRRAFDPHDGFEPIPVPKAGDWLAVHSEPGQTFDEFASSKPQRPVDGRARIYLQPLGEFPKNRSPSLEKLKAYAGAYFGLQVQLLPPLALTGHSLTTRINPFTRNRQVLTGDVLALLTRRLPADGFCILAITMEDLYPDPSWNFVFGQASLRGRVGVYSFARYDPAFYGQERGKGYQELLLRRSCRVLSHEMGHMFGLKHCVFFRCVLNGSNHLAESDSRPLRLCPVCLRKLHHVIGFDVAERYRALLDSYRKLGFDAEARWTESRLHRITQGQSSQAPTEKEGSQ